MTALEVGLLDSVAWREEGWVHVVLHLPEVSTDQRVAVRFRSGERRVRRPATVTPAATGVLVAVTARGPRLAGGTWRIGVRVGEAETFTRVDARLLVRRGRPVALLPGPAPETRMPAPDPTPPAASPGLPTRLAHGVRRRLRR